MADRREGLDCEQGFNGRSCEKSSELLLSCNGPRYRQSPTAIHRIIEAGYPADRIPYDRDGMRVWRMLVQAVRVSGEGKPTSTLA